MSKERLFRFKKFAVSHSRSAMKVGVDSVLLGAWADLSGRRAILDAGSGCGLLALMAAQRNPDAEISGIEIDPEAASEASENFASSPWPDRLECINADFTGWADDAVGRYDFIISNPPYFNSGFHISDARSQARHQNRFSPAAIFAAAKRLLVAGGRIAMVLPYGEIFEAASESARKNGFRLVRKCDVRGRAELPVKRVLAEWADAKSIEDGGLSSGSGEEMLVLESAPGVPTEAHRRLCREFYLKF